MKNKINENKEEFERKKQKLIKWENDLILNEKKFKEKINKNEEIDLQILGYKINEEILKNKINLEIQVYESEIKKYSLRKHKFDKKQKELLIFEENLKNLQLKKKKNVNFDKENSVKLIE